MAATLRATAAVHGLVMLIRVIAFFAGGATSVVAGFGFYQAIQLIQGFGSDILFLTYTYLQVGSFLCAMCVYFAAFGILIMLGEVRARWLQSTILKYFLFLKTFFGRGLFYIFTGSLMVLVGQLYPQIVGGTLVGCGVLEIMFACCYTRDASSNEAVVVVGTQVIKTPISTSAAASSAI